MRHTVVIPPPGTPLVATVVSIDGRPRIILRDGPTLVGEFPDVAALVAAGVHLPDVTIKENR